MNNQLSLFGDVIENENPWDLVYTPDEIAKKIVTMFSPSGKILEPCKGKGVFLKYLPKNTEWCEIKEGRDFFDYNEKVDWIITNPPYSIYDKFIEHCFELSDNIVILVPLGKALSKWERIIQIKNYGGIKKIWLLPSRRCGFPFGYPCGVFYFKRNYKGVVELEYDTD